jgi:hypothetical protein
MVRGDTNQARLAKLTKEETELFNKKIENVYLIEDSSMVKKETFDIPVRPSGYVDPNLPPILHDKHLTVITFSCNKLIFLKLNEGNFLLLSNVSRRGRCVHCYY